MMDPTLITIIVLLLALLVINVRNFIRWKRRFEVKGVKDIHKIEDLEVRLSSVLRSIREACIFVRTSDFTILEFNKRTYQLTGYTREELSKKSLHELIFEVSKVDLGIAIHKLLEGDTGVQLFFELRRSDGVTIPVEISVRRVRWRNESALLLVMLDSLDKMKLKEQAAGDKERISSIADVMSVFNSSSDEQQQFLDLSAVMRRAVPHQRISILFMDEPGDELLGHYCDARQGTKINRERVVLAESGAYQQVVKTRKPVQIGNLSANGDPVEAEMARQGFCSALLIPLIIRENVIGTVGMFDMRPGVFSSKEVETVSMLAEHIALGVYVWNLSKERERKTQRLKQILVTSNSFRLQVFLDDLLREIVWSIRFSTAFDSVALGMMDRDSDRVFIKALASENKEVIRNLIGTSLSWNSFSKLMDDKNRVGRSYLIYTAEPILLTSRLSGDDFSLEEDGSFAEVQPRVSLFVPIESRLGEVVGVLLVEDPQDGIRPSLETIQTLEIFANQVAVVIENQRLFAEAKQKSGELEVLNEKLRASKKNIEAAAKKLEKVNAELREVDRFKADFLQNITHELKSPIAPILINSDMLLSRRLGDLEPMQEEVVQSISQSARRLNDLIMDLLYLSRMEDGKLEFMMEPLEVQRLVSSCMREIYPVAKEKGITIEETVSEDAAMILGDERHLIQLLTNLLRNAIKFTAEGGDIFVSARNAATNGAQIEIEVQDTGVGIPESKLSKIFDRFYQVDGSTTRKFKGAGLGLAIVKKIVEAHNGDIEIQSEVGKGSTFKVRLPAKQYE